MRKYIFIELKLSFIDVGYREFINEVDFYDSDESPDDYANSFASKYCEGIPEKTDSGYLFFNGKLEVSVMHYQEIPKEHYEVLVQYLYREGNERRRLRVKQHFQEQQNQNKDN